MDVVAARRTLVQLRQLERELIELERLHRADALERVREAVGRIGELGTPEAILERAAEELGTSTPFGTVLVSEVRTGVLVPRSLWLIDERASAADVLASLAQAAIRIEYPLAEAEVGRAQGAIRVQAQGRGHRPEPALSAALASNDYVVAPLRLEGKTVGLLHCAGVPATRAENDLAEELASVYADGLARAFERAALRRILQRHRDELHAAVQWTSGRLSQLATDRVRTEPALRPSSLSGGTDALTAREGEVLELLTRGRTNLQIAQTLVISEGTVKYHVKNVLRKLGATSRADAVARHLQA
jgi:LuxR family transcriptional regulator, regulator of acetate metabolism